jgi:hypothetical protein
MSPLAGKLRFTGSVTCGTGGNRKVFERGDEVPADAGSIGLDMNRLKRLGLVAPGRSIDHDE